MLHADQSEVAKWLKMKRHKMLFPYLKELVTTSLENGWHLLLGYPLATRLEGIAEKLEGFNSTILKTKVEGIPEKVEGFNSRWGIPEKIEGFNLTILKTEGWHLHQRRCPKNIYPSLPRGIYYRICWCTLNGHGIEPMDLASKLFGLFLKINWEIIYLKATCKIRPQVTR